MRRSTLRLGRGGASQGELSVRTQLNVERQRGKPQNHIPRPFPLILSLYSTCQFITLFLRRFPYKDPPSTDRAPPLGRSASPLALRSRERSKWSCSQPLDQYNPSRSITCGQSTYSLLIPPAIQVATRRSCAASPSTDNTTRLRQLCIGTSRGTESLLYESSPGAFPRTTTRLNRLLRYQNDINNIQTVYIGIMEGK